MERIIWAMKLICDVEWKAGVEWLIFSAKFKLGSLLLVWNIWAKLSAQIIQCQVYNLFAQLLSFINQVYSFFNHL